MKTRVAAAAPGSPRRRRTASGGGARSWAATISKSLADSQHQSRQAVTSSFDLQRLRHGPPHWLKRSAEPTLASSLLDPPRGESVSPRSAALVLTASTQRTLGVPTALVASHPETHLAAHLAAANATPRVAKALPSDPREFDAVPMPASDRRLPKAVPVTSRDYYGPYGDTKLRVHPRTACDYFSAASSSPRATAHPPHSARPATARPVHPGERQTNFVVRFPKGGDGTRRPVSAFRARPPLHVTLLPSGLAPDEPALHGDAIPVWQSTPRGTYAAPPTSVAQSVAGDHELLQLLDGELNDGQELQLMDDVRPLSSMRPSTPAPVSSAHLRVLDATSSSLQQHAAGGPTMLQKSGLV